MIKRSHEQWQSLFVAHKASDLSASDFCKEHNLCPKYFSLRQRQLNGRASSIKKKTKNKQKTFVQVKPDNTIKPLVNDSMILLQGAFGELSFPKDVSATWLARFVSALS